MHVTSSAEATLFTTRECDETNRECDEKRLGQFPL
jgi:hypothetical protein